MRFATLNERAEFPNQNGACNMSVNIILNLSRLPSEQAAPSIVSLCRDLRINLLSQQCGCFKQDSLGGMLLVLKLPNGHIKQANDPVHPFA